MPPLTPSPIKAISALSSQLSAFSFQRLDFPLFNFLLRQLHQLLAAGRPRRASAEELPGTGAGNDDELERIRHTGSIGHCGSFRNDLTICSATGRMVRCRARSAQMMARSL